ncbi:NYN domain-containing protein [uncultured Paludibaculum sp.]|uniref:NYN domain-containing protein n=1 Tax=uncultured Paludibaculum sp. TaxID=1765020 RepID=UPI002AABEF06|nr:NYN domain-containing protein [uncultured Paludibaculum sp.]
MQATLRAAILIDGGYLRVLTRKASLTYNPELIEKVGLACLDLATETLHRILYYDCAPYTGAHRQPVSGEFTSWTGNEQWLTDLSCKDYFAVRRGVLKFRGYKLKRIPYQPTRALVDSDFEPVFEQKGVDMRIGLDIATMSDERIVDRVILVTGDTDCIPAMKHARKAGLQVVLVQLPNSNPAQELFPHTDLKRAVTWPTS